MLKLVMEISEEYLEGWLEELKQAWIKIDFNKIENIFAEIENYYEGPFAKPVGNVKDVLNLWKEIDGQKIDELNFDKLAIERNVAIVHWYLRMGEDKYDGIYEIKFKENLKCSEFRQWTVKKL